MFPISLKPGKIDVLGDTLSRAPHASMNILEILKMDLDEILSGSNDDKILLRCTKAYKKNKMCLVRS